MSEETAHVLLECEDCSWRWEGKATWNGIGWHYDAPPHEHEHFTERVTFEAELYTTAPAHNFKVTL